MANGSNNYVNPDLLEAKGKEIAGIHDELSATLDHLTLVINSLEEVWKDDVQVMTSEKYADLKKDTLPNFLQLIENYGLLMVEQAKENRAVVEAGKQRAQKFL